MAFGAYFLASFGASFLSAAFLSPAFPAGLVSAGFLASVPGVVAVVAAGVSVFPFLCLPESKTVSSGKISVTTPAATVFPPSLKANLAPLVIVNGK